MTVIKLLVAFILMLLSTIATADKVTDAKIGALDTRMQRIERVVDNQALVKLSKRIETLQREVQELRGENERLAHELNTLKTRQREQYLNVDRRLQSSTDTKGAQNRNAPLTFSTAPASSQVAATTPGTTVSVSASNDAAQDYKNAFNLLKQGKYDDSIVAFEAFLQIHPDSKYAANAQYWLAEANYVSRYYPQALTEFSKVINKYPASSKVADAKLKLGFTHYELEQYEEARVELTRLRAQFPNSSVASLAQQRLKRMSREGR